MAVQDKYIDSNVAAGKKTDAVHAAGAPLLCLPFSFEVAAADSDTSVYRLGKLPANAVPIRAEIYADASLAASDWDLGLYKPGVGGAVVDKDLLMDGVDLNAGVAVTAGANNALANLGGADPVANQGKALWELLGLSLMGAPVYDLALTGNTAGGGAGTISGFILYALK